MTGPTSIVLQSAAALRLGLEEAANALISGDLVYRAALGAAAQTQRQSLMD